MPYQTRDDYIIRSAMPDDVPRISALFDLVYGESSHPCRHPDDVHRSLQHDIWRVALKDDHLVACMAGLWLDGYQVYERARGVTHPEFRAHGMARQLMDEVLQAMWVKPQCDLVIGCPRSDAITRIVIKETAPPFVIVGHDGGMNIANGTREFHLIGMSVNPYRQPLRIEAENPSGSPSAFVDEQVLTRLAFRTQRGVYPPTHVVGPATACRVHAQSWCMGYRYDPDCQSLQITNLEGPEDDANRQLAGLAACLLEAPTAMHRWAYVLSDKTDFIVGMQDLGFRVSAFLPGWFPTAQARYDCVLLTQCSSPEPPVAHGIQAWINRFDRHLNPDLTLT